MLDDLEEVNDRQDDTELTLSHHEHLLAELKRGHNASSELHQSHYNELQTLKALLMSKGVFSEVEWNLLFARMQQATDQHVAGPTGGGNGR